MSERGRPTVYTEELAREICLLLAEGRTLREICRSEGMPPESTVRRWAMDDFNGFSAHYARAREVGYFSMADEIVEISDDGSNDWMTREGVETVNSEHIARSRLRVDTRKWLLGKALPKIYGDKMAIEASGPGGGPIQTEDVSARDILSSRLAGIAARTGKTDRSGEPD